jgi:hypothetical protein
MSQALRASPVSVSAQDITSEGEGQRLAEVGAVKKSADYRDYADRQEIVS